ncbi:hypothetical protein KEM48_011211 [Puccinia striiformis f. sp. tritici PST-130]|nr:hypothetical protein KEM48_011211 [Puccinia striiformis f. sp. tritici PST-130]
MDIKNSITDHTEFSGSDDTSDSPAAEQHEDSSAAEQHAAKALSPEDAARNIATRNPKPAVSELSPPIRDSLLSSYSKGLNLQEIQARLTKETGVTVATCTVKRYLSRLDLRLNGDDLADGKRDFKKISKIIQKVVYNWRLQHSDSQVSDPCIPNSAHSTEIGDIIRRVVYELLKGVDPERVTGWLKQTCKQRVFHVRGPNHVWAIDGHDKLKPFGITVYGFIDAWSRKILGLFVHVTNNDPKHIGVYYLKLVLRLGGIPLKVTADYGTETCDVSTYQMMLSIGSEELLLKKPPSACITQSRHIIKRSNAFGPK